MASMPDRYGKYASTTSLDRNLFDSENIMATCIEEQFNATLKRSATFPKTAKMYKNGLQVRQSQLIYSSFNSKAKRNLLDEDNISMPNVAQLPRSKGRDNLKLSACVIERPSNKSNSLTTPSVCKPFIKNHGDVCSVNSIKISQSDADNGSHQTVSPTSFKNQADAMENWFSLFSCEQKNVLLKRLLSHCFTTQTHVLCQELNALPHPGCPDNCQDHIRWLPQMLAFHIFSFLDPVSLSKASRVCRAWYDLANEPSLWRNLCALPQWKLSSTCAPKQRILHTPPSECVQWKNIFAQSYRLHTNWMKGRCTVREFEGHTEGVSCVQFDNTRIVSGSYDKTIKVWNIRTNSPWLVQTLVGHSHTVRCLHLNGNRLVSGSTDETIKVWDLSTEHTWSSIACKVTMTGHLDSVRCLQVDDEKVISGSYDKTLKIWDIKTGHCTKSLRGHEAAVLCVQFDANKIISGSCDKTIKVWNFDGHCIMTLQGHQDAVTCLQFDAQRIVSGSIDCTLKFWDIQNGECRKTIDWKASEGHTGVIRCLQADSWRVVSASDDRTIKVWSLETGKRLVTLRNHEGGVTCLKFNDSIIVSGSYDKTVKLWDFSSV